MTSSWVGPLQHLVERSDVYPKQEVSGLARFLRTIWWVLVTECVGRLLRLCFAGQTTGPGDGAESRQRGDYGRTREQQSFQTNPPDEAAEELDFDPVSLKVGKGRMASLNTAVAGPTRLCLGYLTLSLHRELHAVQPGASAAAQRRWCSSCLALCVCVAPQEPENLHSWDWLSKPFRCILHKTVLEVGLLLLLLFPLLCTSTITAILR